VFSGRSGGNSKREQYVDNYLYKPKLRADRSTEEIEYEKQKKDCSFKPTLSKGHNVAVSKIKLYIQTGQSPKVVKTPNSPSRLVLNQGLNTERLSMNKSELNTRKNDVFDNSNRPVILQMEVLISQGKVDFVIVRQGDDIEQIVQKFA
jgi:hypothetical protein